MLDEAGKTVGRKLLDPGIRDVPVYAIEEARAFADSIIAAREASWVQNKPARAA